VAATLAEYFAFLGYPDAFLLRIAERAIRNEAWSLARQALETFCYEQTFCGVDAEALGYLARLIAGEEPVGYSGEYVELTEAVEEDE
jgi:hypothetical protein